MTRPRVLVVAEAANPDWVSVPLIGWSLSQALRAVADTHLVTHIRNRDAILAAGLTEGADFTAIDNEALARPLWALGTRLRGGEGRGFTMLQAVSALSYPLFERLVWRRFGGEIARGDWDIVHRVTPLSPTQSGPLATKCAAHGVPFVLGPLNGGVPWPHAFDTERRAEREWLSYVRGAYRALPGRAATLRHARAILAGSGHTASEIPDRFSDKVIRLPENAVDPARFDARRDPSDGPLRACFIGRMVPYKGPDMALEAALPLLRSGAMTLDLIGDGPLLPALRARVAEAGVADAVTLHGWLPHASVQGVAARSSLLLFPSIREFGGGAVLEAMALGLAPLVVDYAGPAELLTPATGYTVPLTDRAGIVADLRQTLLRLAGDPADVAARGAAARAAVRADFTWDAKAKQIAQVYDWVLGRRSDRPVFRIGADAASGTGARDDMAH